MNIKINVERGRRLLSSIVRHGEEHLDMQHWFKQGGCEGKGLWLREASKVDMNECGTTACVAGHAALLMKEDGLVASDVDHVAGWLFKGDVIDIDIESQYVFHDEMWWNLGRAGEDALNICEEQGEYYAVVFLLKHLISEAELANSMGVNK